jgi:hypothetical protein
MADSVNHRGFPRGVNNLLADHDEGLRGALRYGVNVDILKSGLPRTRRGIRQAIADAGAHSLYSDGARMVWATANTLKLARANLSPITLRTDAKFAAPLSYTEINGEIYFTSQKINGKITAGDTYEPWGVTPPSTAPSLSAATGARFVQVTCAFVQSTGDVSGAPRGAVVACGDTPSIAVTGIPQSSDARVVATRLYVTDLDGKEFYKHADVPAGVTTFVVAGTLARGEKLKTQFMTCPPLGHLVDYESGRLHVAVDTLVIPTEALRYGLCRLDNYAAFPERVTLLKAVEDGLYVSADETYFISGLGTPGVKQRTVLPFRAIAGAACNVPGSTDVMWLSERGFVRGGNGGAVRLLTDGTMAPELFASASMGVAELEGHKAAIAISRAEGARNPLVSEDFIAAEAARPTQ